MKIRLDTKRVLNSFLSDREIMIMARAFFYDEQKDIREVVIQFILPTAKSLYHLCIFSHFTGQGISVGSLVPELLLIRYLRESREQTYKVLPPIFSTWNKLYPLLAKRWQQIEEEVETTVRGVKNCTKSDCEICKPVVPLDFKVFLEILKGLSKGPPSGLAESDSLEKVLRQLSIVAAVVPLAV